LLHIKRSKKLIIPLLLKHLPQNKGKPPAFFGGNLGENNGKK
jgi:hypothetical protein